MSEVLFNLNGYHENLPIDWDSSCEDGIPRALHGKIVTPEIISTTEFQSHLELYSDGVILEIPAGGTPLLLQRSRHDIQSVWDGGWTDTLKPGTEGTLWMGMDYDYRQLYKTGQRSRQLRAISIGDESQIPPNYLYCIGDARSLELTNLLSRIKSIVIPFPSNTCESLDWLIPFIRSSLIVKPNLHIALMTEVYSRDSVRDYTLVDDPNLPDALTQLLVELNMHPLLLKRTNFPPEDFATRFGKTETFLDIQYCCPQIAVFEINHDYTPQQLRQMF
jgi:hypothetical protein